MMTMKMSCHESDAGQKVTHNYFKNTTTARCEIMARWPNALNAPGLTIQKQIEMGTKWRHHVPPVHQDKGWYVEPPKELKSEFKSEKKEKS